MTTTFLSDDASFARDATPERTDRASHEDVDDDGDDASTRTIHDDAPPISSGVGSARGARICPATKALLPNAAHRGKLHAVEYLIKDVGSDPNVVWRQGMTPLILAARAGRTDIVNLLLTVDSLDLDLVDNAGKTAVDYAIANGRNEIVTLLLERKLHLTTTTTEVLAEALAGME
jgi:hypothetical protein